MGGGRGIPIERRRDVDEHAIADAAAPEFEVRERRGGEIAGTVRPQILFGDAAEIHAQEIAGQCPARAWHALQCVRDYLFDEGEARGGNFAEHGLSPSRARDYTCGPTRSWRMGRSEL